MLRGNILTPDGWIRGALSFEAGRIASLDGTPVDPPNYLGNPGNPDSRDNPADPDDSVASNAASDDNAVPYILPGFIDLHVHGGGGADVMDAGDDPAGLGSTCSSRSGNLADAAGFARHSAPAALAALAASATGSIDAIGPASPADAPDPLAILARTHARHGTTSLLATTMTAPRAQLARVLARLNESAQKRVPGGARVLGVHLEGPYLNPGKLGAQPDAAVPAALDEVLGYLRLAPVRVVTIAPEIAGHLQVIAALTARGVRVQLGHSLATYDETVAALAQGACGFTHLFNAMSPLHHRQPGMVGAALAHAQYAELIPDLLHVHPGALLVALRAIKRAYVVTDSTAAAGMPDGTYRLGSQRVRKCLGGVRLADGTLAGSALTMDAALRNLVSLGLTLADASNRLSRHAADYLGLHDRGRLVPGAWADCVVLDRHLALKAVYVEGEAVAVNARVAGS